MLRSSLFVLLICLFAGCDGGTQKIVLPTTPFSEEQKIAIAKEDAAACNCGRDFEASHSSRDD